jgi:sugar phosphate permease
MLLLGGWREAFWALGGLGLLWAIAFYWWYRDRPEEKPSVSAAEAELIRGDAAAGSVYDESHDLRGVPWRRMFLSTNLWAVYLTAAAVSFSWYVNVTFLPRYLKDVFEVDYKDSQIMTGLPLFVSAFFCLVGGALSDYLIRWTGSRRWGRSLPGVIGFGLAGVCDLLIPYVNSPQAVIALICTACAVQDLAIPGLWAACADIGGRYAGTLSGVMNAMGCLGGILSPLFTGDVAVAYGWNAVFLMFAATYFLGSLLWLRIDATERLVRT